MNTISDEIFWKAVDDMAWEANGFDYDKIGKDLEARIWAEYEDQQAGEIAKSLRLFMNNPYRRLYKAVNKAARDSKAYVGGDDAFDDLLSHIIGLGKAEYDRVMENPALAIERFQMGDYRESFAYCFHAAHERAWRALRMSRAGQPWLG